MVSAKDPIQVGQQSLIQPQRFYRMPGVRRVGRDVASGAKGVGMVRAKVSIQVGQQFLEEPGRKHYPHSPCRLGAFSRMA